MLFRSEKDGKVALIVGVGKSLQSDKLDAVKILNDIGTDFGIRGGGRQDFAQAGGRSSNGLKAEDILKKAEAIIKAKLT